MENKFKLKNGSGTLCCKGCGRQDKQLNTYDWLANVPDYSDMQDIVEVQFKNTRKGYYRNSNKLKLEKGDIVAVEASPGHDIGVVTLTGRLVPLQVKKANLKPDAEIKRISLCQSFHVLLKGGQHHAFAVTIYQWSFRRGFLHQFFLSILAVHVQIVLQRYYFSSFNFHIFLPLNFKH
jgi:hypothetical protein